MAEVTALVDVEQSILRELLRLAELNSSQGLLPADFEAASAQEGVDEVRRYLREHVDRILNACYLLFLCVAEDMTGRPAAERTREASVARALDYFG